MHSVWAAEPDGRPASWILLFSNVRFVPLTQIRLLFLLSWISELRTTTLLAASRWKIWIASQPLQSTFQPSTTMLLAWSERKVRAVAGPTKEMLLPPAAAGDVPVLEVVDDDVLAGRGAERDAGRRDRGLVRGRSSRRRSCRRGRGSGRRSGPPGRPRSRSRPGCRPTRRAWPGARRSRRWCRPRGWRRRAPGRAGRRWRRSRRRRWSSSCRWPSCGWRRSRRRHRPRSRTCRSFRT